MSKMILHLGGLLILSFILAGCPGDLEEKKPDILSISTNPLTVYHNQLVRFKAEMSSRSSDNNTYTWDFGDGTTGTGKEVFHTYTTAGQYGVTLNANNDNGIDSETKIITVYGDIGRLSFWTNYYHSTAISVQVNNTYSASVTAWYQVFPGCTGSGLAIFNALPHGTYTYYATSPSKTWQGTVNLNSPCEAILLN